MATSHRLRADVATPRSSSPSLSCSTRSDWEFSLAREVLELRRQQNLTQKELAERMGTSQPAIARVESGNYRNVSLAFIRRLADALGARPEIHLRKRGAQVGQSAT